MAEGKEIKTAKYIILKMLTSTYNCQILLFLVIYFYSSQQSAFKFPVGIENERGDTWVLNTGGGASCVKLKDCSTFSWLMNRKYVQNEVIQLHLDALPDSFATKSAALTKSILIVLLH